MSTANRRVGFIRDAHDEETFVQEIGNSQPNEAVALETWALVNTWSQDTMDSR